VQHIIHTQLSREARNDLEKIIMVEPLDDQQHDLLDDPQDDLQDAHRSAQDEAEIAG
jgi:hypothetical protein